MNYETVGKLVSKLMNTKGIWFKSILPFMPDPRLVNPVRMIDVSGLSLIQDSVIFEVAHYNGF